MRIQTAVDRNTRVRFQKVLASVGFTKCLGVLREFRRLHVRFASCLGVRRRCSVRVGRGARQRVRSLGYTRRAYGRASSFVD